jgi:hypothetical protein
LGADGIKPLGFPEELQETLRFLVGPVDLEEFVEDDGPGNYREVDKYYEYELDDQTCTGKKDQNSYLPLMA